METKIWDIEKADGWVAVSVNPANITIQLRGGAAAEVFGGPSAPEAGDTARGVLLSSPEDRVFAASGLSGENTFRVRCVSARADDQVLIAVMHDGTSS